MKRLHSELLGILALAAALLLAWSMLAPGLSGGFLFDDYANLPALGTTGPVDDWATFWRYITSGTADPTGRPLALLSFLLDARNWPADPRPFLHTNLVLHLLNGALLFLLLRTLGLHAFTQPAGRDRQSRARHQTAAAIQNKPAMSSSDRQVPPQADPGLRQPSPAGTGSVGNAGPTLRINLAAVLGAAFWLLHPLFVSTTLYIVQREAMLPATFVLLGLLAWLHGRRRLLTGHRFSGLAWLVVGLGGCTVLAVLSKANGILLPALALVLEYTVARAADRLPNTAEAGREAMTQPADAARKPEEPGSALHAARNNDEVERRASSLYRRAMLALAWLPAALIALYLLHAAWNGMVHGISATRPWTLGQRLLTEPRILMDYLGLLWLPRPFTPGLFNDSIHVSTSLLQPATTLPAIAAVLSLILGAVLLRRRWPALAAAVLFYFVGQAIESSTLALELYFEHRNYLPAMLMFWPAAIWLSGLPVRSQLPPAAARRAPRRGKSLLDRGKPLSPRTVTALKTGFSLVALAGLALMCHSRASLWGKQHDQALLWAQLNPQSPRAQAYAAQAEISAGHPARAAARLRPLLTAQPDQVQIALNLFGAECLMGKVPESTIDASRRALATTRNPGSLLQHWFSRLIDSSDKPICPEARPATISRLLAAGLKNPHLQNEPGRMQDLWHLEGLLALKQGRSRSALDRFDRALDLQPRISAALQQAALLGSRGYPRCGLAHLDHYQTLVRHEVKPDPGMPRIHAWVLQQQAYWQHEMARLRATLRQDARAKPLVAPPATNF